MSPAGVRLSDVERAERKLVEADLQRQITDLAEAFGWTWVHWRALLNRRGFYEVPFRGPLGKGWPDLTLVRERDRRLIFAELKRELEQPTPEQQLVAHVLRSLSSVQAGADPALIVMPRVDVFLWRPSDLREPIHKSPIYQALR